MDFRKTRWSLGIPLREYSKGKRLYSWALRNKRFQLKRLDPHSRYLNVGCGTNIVPGFIHLDWEWIPGVDVCWDVRRGLPFKDRSLKGIYTEHCLEHLKLEDTRAVLKEFKRTLEPQGLVRIILPSAGFYLDLYHRVRSGEAVTFPYPEAGFTPLMHVNRNFYGHGHCYGYDEETLSQFLREAGFSEVHVRRFREGDDPKLLIDTEHRAIESLYMEARP